MCCLTVSPQMEEFISTSSFRYFNTKDSKTFTSFIPQNNSSARNTFLYYEEKYLVFLNLLVSSGHLELRSASVRLSSQRMFLPLEKTAGRCRFGGQRNLPQVRPTSPPVFNTVCQQSTTAHQEYVYMMLRPTSSSC